MTEVWLRAVAAFGRGDMEAARACFSDDAVWSVPGRSLIAGDHRGWDGISRFLGLLVSLSGGTFRTETLDVADGRDYVLAYTRNRAERNGRQLDLTACYAIRVAGQHVAEVRGHYSDGHALDAFWS